jgi:hypothetical protein
MMPPPRLHARRHRDRGGDRGPVRCPLAGCHWRSLPEANRTPAGQYVTHMTERHLFGHGAKLPDPLPSYAGVGYAIATGLCFALAVVAQAAAFGRWPL